MSHGSSALDVPPQSVSSAQAVRAARIESVSHFAAAIAHDLNNVLTAVLGYGTLLSERVAENPEALNDAREVLAAAERAATLTRHLLAFSRRQVLAPKRADVGGMFETVRPRLLESIGKRVTLELQADDGTPAVSIDVDRLQDALVALAVNASDAMPEGGRLRIEAAGIAVDGSSATGHVQLEAGQYVRISVTDSGRGIPADIQDRVFEPFFTTKMRGLGEGLGLSTVYGFIRQSGGHVLLQSEEGRGTTVQLYLPILPVATASAQSANDPVVRRGSGQTVLLVDDTDAIRRQVADSLRRSGYRVIVANSASEALYVAGCQRGPIHMLLTDVIMPGSSGVDLARELRTERRGLRVLYMSGFSGHEAVQQGVLAAGESFIEKPFSRDALLQKVAALLR
ncbi:MAG: ATP-binding protein [Vicinamibacterales bacterium]